MRPPSHSFCPKCGQALEDRYVEDEGRNRLVCSACSQIHYLNPIVVAGVVPQSENGVWLLRRAIEPRRGFWTFPAGFMEIGETVEEAAQRETREELNMSVRLERLLGVYSLSSMTNVQVVFLGTAVSEPSAGSETLDFALFAPHRVPWQELAFWSTRMALEDWLRHLESG